MAASSKCLSIWNLQDIAEWLNTHNLTECLHLFQSNQFNGALIIQLDHRHIDTFIARIPFKQQILLKHALAKLKKDYKLRQNPNIINQHKKKSKKTKRRRRWKQSEEDEILKYMNGQSSESVPSLATKLNR